MSKNSKERVMAIIIGVVMIGSMAGFALSSVVYTAPPAQEETPHIVNRFMSPRERAGVLSSGKVLVYDFYQENCTECMGLNMLLESFANSFKDYMVLERSVANSTKIQMIGRGGEIRDIPLNITEKELVDMFCSLALKQPKECLLMNI